MSTLHTVNKSPFEHKTLVSCARVCLKGDNILLIEDGVYAALLPFAQKLSALHERGVGIFALKEDAQSRGLKADLAPHIKLTDYAGFVRLSCEHQTIQSWY